MFRYYWSRVSDHGKLLLQLRLPVAMSSACFEKLSTRRRRRRRRRAWRHLPCYWLAGWRRQAAGSWKATMHQFAERKLVPTQASSQWRAARGARTSTAKQHSHATVPLCVLSFSKLRALLSHWSWVLKPQLAVLYSATLLPLLLSAYYTCPFRRRGATIDGAEAARTIAAPPPPLPPPPQSRHCRHHRRCRRRLAKLAW